MASVLLGLVAVWSGAAWGIAYHGHREPDPSQTYDAIIVLGCRVYPSGRPSPALVQRVKTAVSLHERGFAPKIVMTGGVGEAAISEAAAAASIAEMLGVPSEAIELETLSTSTEENARFAAEITDARRVLIVTDAYHVLRARRVFSRYFAEVHGAGSTNPHPWPRIRGALREVIALGGYAALGRL